MEKMNGRVLFGAGIRIIGLLSFGRGFVDLLFVILFELGLSNSSLTAEPQYVNFVYGIFYVLGGIYLLRGAPWLVRFAYPQTGEIEKYETEDRS